MQVLAKHMENTQVDNEDVQVYKYLKISMDKYVLHSYFYASDMANMDVVLDTLGWNLLVLSILMCRRNS